MNMDIDLLAKMVGELIVAHDQVGLPGVGTFVAEMVPASFSDKGFTINPPYRRLSFYPGRLEDTLLIDFYAASNRIGREAAAAYITQYLAELRAVLEQRKSIALPGLGRLRATRENHLFFVADEGLDIFPAGIGLRPVSLKSHMPEEDPVVIDVPLPQPEVPAPAQSPAAEPVLPEPRPEPISEPTPEPEQEPETEPAPDAAESVPETTPAPPSPDIPETAESQEAPESQEVPETTESPETPGTPETSEDPESRETPDTPESQETPEIPDVPQQKAPHRSLPEWAWTDPEQTVRKQRERRRLPRWPFILLIAAVVFFGGFILLAHIAPDFIDSILYSPDELWIIKY